jgi:hypothetical protein
MAKGGNYERELSRKFSLWWTNGARDDIFWRTSQSGGRATTRAKKGMTTDGQHGDLAATDPIGFPFIQVLTAEFKCGYEGAYPWQLFDSKSARRSKALTQFEKFLRQASKSHRLAGASLGPLLVTRRDRREELVFMNARVFKMFKDGVGDWEYEFAFFRVKASDTGKLMNFYTVHLDTFFKLDPKEIIKCQKNEKQ